MRSPYTFLAAVGLFCGLLASGASAAEKATLTSPDGDIQLAFRQDKSGRAICDVSYRRAAVTSIGIGLTFAGAAPLDQGLRIASVSPSRLVDESYAIPVGKASFARDLHQETVITLEELGPQRRRLELELRAFDDGVAFRYRLPAQASLGAFQLLEEATTFRFADDPMTWRLPLNSFTTSYEKHYDRGPLSGIPSDSLIGLPILLRQRRGAGESTFVAVTEANLVDFAGLYLAPSPTERGALVARLSPLPGRQDGVKVLGKAPHVSPWRVLMISDRLGRLLESDIVFHLSDPPKIADVSWIRPGKTTFPWWNGYVLEGVDFEPGLNTATHKHYIDFCAEHGVELHSLDGTNIAWYGGPIVPDGPTDITKAVPEIDLPELLEYAREKGVRLRLWMHWRALKKQIDEAFPLYEKWGIEGVMVDFMDRDDQEMVAFYHEVAEKAARHKLTVTWHGAYKPTGMERTWPNVLTYEAALNQEYNKWDRLGTPPSHNLDVALIRMLAGPLDYHQGGMRNVLPKDFQPRDKAPLVQGTRAHQLALYIVYQNHLPMMVDFPAAYRGQAGLEFIAKAPVTWDESRVLFAEMDRCLVVARRKGEAWYLGGIAGEKEQHIDLPLDFLGPGRYQVEIIGDDPAGGATNVNQRKQIAAAGDRFSITLAPGGGFVARLSK